jgi:murein L,D-transpeptidase YcbB/YkuD
MRFAAALLLVLSAGWGARDPADTNEFIAALIDGRDVSLGFVSPIERSELQALYGPEVAPLWLDGNGRATADLRDALSVLNRVADEGLDPAEYRQELTARLMARDDGAMPPRDRARLDVAVSAGMLRYMRDLHMGRIAPQAVGFRFEAPQEPHDFPAMLRAAISEHRVSALAGALRSPLVQYRLLLEALPRYRSLAAESATTIAGQRVRQIELGLERLRWLPDLGSGPLIALNIPMFRLWAWDAVPSEGPPAVGTDAIVGRALRTETPVFAEELREVVFRPYWNVPRSILRNEVLPAIRRDPDYLRREDMEIVRGAGDNASRVGLTADALAELERGTLRVRQRPGPRNALGLVKFVMPNSENVYLHGTPAQALFARSRRDFSHGCVRLADPIALAEWVLRDRLEWTRDRIVAATLGRETIHVTLPRPIKVILFYTTAAVMPEDGAIRFADDLYRRDATLDRALASLHRLRTRAAVEVNSREVEVTHD